MEYPLTAICSFLSVVVAFVCGNACYLQGKSEERSRTELQAGMAPSTRSRSPNISDIMTKTVTERPTDSSMRGKDELQRQIKELSKALELSEEAVSTNRHHHHHHHDDIIRTIAFITYCLFLVLVSSTNLDPTHRMFRKLRKLLDFSTLSNICH